MDKKNLNEQIEKLFFDLPGIIVYNDKKRIEVQPGVMTPLVVNIKSTFSNCKTRTRIAKELSRLVNPECICVCGIESGGSYYASIIADMLKKPLVLFRKESKNYGLGKRFVGAIPNVKNGLVTIIDDVIGEGKISTVNAKSLMDLGYKVEICAVFSYLPTMKEFMSNVKIVSLVDLNSLCEFGKNIKYFNEKDINLIKKECKYSSR